MSKYELGNRVTFFLDLGSEHLSTIIGLGNKLVENKHKVMALSRKKKRQEVEIFFSDKIEVIYYDESKMAHQDIFNLNEQDILKICRDFEDKYNFKFSFIIAQDRALGRGYLSNAQNYPKRNDSKLPRHKKLAHKLVEFLEYEKIFEENNFTHSFSFHITPILDIFTKYYNVAPMYINWARMSQKVCIYNSPNSRCFKLEAKVKEYLDKPRKVWDYTGIQRNVCESKSLKRFGYSYLEAWLKTLIRFKNDLRVYVASIIKRRKAGGYSHFAWVSFQLKAYKNYKFYKEKAKYLENLSNQKYIYYSMHFEPEWALLSVSPEFNNTLESIIWISKSLPVDYLLVVKEHPMEYGFRTKEYYEFLSQIPNVVFASQNIDAVDWIASSEGVATITGSAAFEAVYFEKPVISFGKHQVVNFLPTVFYCCSFFEVEVATKQICEGALTTKNLSLAKNILFQAIDDSGFELPGFEDRYKDIIMDENYTDICYKEVINYLGCDVVNTQN